MPVPKILVVFGMGVSGNQLGVDTIANLKTAKAVSNDHGAVIFSGGVFAPGQTTPVAKLMEKWWGDNCPEWNGRIFTETMSLITRQNVINVIRIIEKNCLNFDLIGITIVSERWHLLGIKTLFFRLRRKFVKVQCSDYQLPIREIPGRLARIPLYLLDPLGKGRLTRRVVLQRTQ